MTTIRFGKPIEANRRSKVDRGRPAEFVRDGVTRLLPIEAQKIGNDFLDLVIRQVGVWHSLWIVEAPMCRLQEMCQ